MAPTTEPRLPEATKELWAALELLELTTARGRLGLALPDDPMDPGEAVETIADGSCLSPVAKLDLLSRLASSPRVDDGHLVPLAASLVDPEASPEHVGAIADRLIDRLKPVRPGDPLGRSVHDLVRPSASSQDPLVGKLVPALAGHIWNISCHAAEVRQDGQTNVLRIGNVMHTTTKLEDFPAMVDPLRWPACKLQNAFFRDMVHVTTTTEPLPAPDGGWSKTIRETVDFSLGAGLDGYEYVTDLDFVYWDSNDPSVPRSMGTTYRLNRSEGDEITRDSGYLIVEDLATLVSSKGWKGPDIRRVSNLKEVRFSKWRPFLEVLCPIWNLTSCMIVENCTQPEPHRSDP